jgi:hypothetical protein
MSVKIMGLVWDTPMEPSQKFVLLALADHADHEGNNAYPSLGLLARKTGYAERHVRRTLRLLEESKYIERGELSVRRTYTYSIIVARLGKGDTESAPPDTESPSPRTYGPPTRTQSPPGGDTESPDPSINRPLIRECDPGPTPHINQQRRKMPILTPLYFKDGK